jgi:hypothetical protein
VVIVDSAKGLGELRTRLGIVAEMWFAQKDFSDVRILEEFQESLGEKVKDGNGGGGLEEGYFGELMSSTSFPILVCPAVAWH